MVWVVEKVCDTAAFSRTTVSHYMKPVFSQRKIQSVTTRQQATGSTVFNNVVASLTDAGTGWTLRTNQDCDATPEPWTYLTYNSDGQVVKLIDPQSNQTSWNYDAFDKVVITEFGSCHSRIALSA